MNDQKEATDLPFQVLILTAGDISKEGSQASQKLASPSQMATQGNLGAFEDDDIEPTQSQPDRFKEAVQSYLTHLAEDPEVTSLIKECITKYHQEWTQLLQVMQLLFPRGLCPHQDTEGSADSPSRNDPESAQRDLHFL